MSAGEGHWQSLLGMTRDVVRQEVVTRQLLEQLSVEPLRILDVGCGQGTQTLRMAARGHRVTAVDPSADLLARLESDLTAELRGRVRVVRGAVQDLTGLVEPAAFDVVLCHGLLMYFPDPGPVLAALSEVLAPGGTLSLLVRNGDALAMRAGLLGDWRTAAAQFGTTSYRNRLGIQARADRLTDLTAALCDHGLTLTTWYGVRVFTDTAPDDAPPPTGPELTALLTCEERASRTDPYRRVAALLHLFAVRD